MLEREQIDFLLTAAYNAAVRAGAKINEIYTQYEDFYVSLKKDSTPITIADREAHSIIRQALTVTRIPMQSEEGRDIQYEERRTWDLYWLVDPLDGTEEFIKRNGEFTVNIALMVNNQPFFGVIYVPTSNTIYFSDPDRGSFCKTGVVAEVTSAQTISQIFGGAKQLPFKAEKNSPPKVTLSRSHESNFSQQYQDKLREFIGDFEIVEYGSSLKFCLVAEGTADLYLRTSPTMEWDTAAGEAIVAGSGGEVMTLNYEKLHYNIEELENPSFICRSKFTPQIRKINP